MVLVSHDTADLGFATHPATKGLGDLGGGKGGVNLGLSLHSALALSVQGLALGLVGQKLWAPVATGKGSHQRGAPLESKESYRLQSRNRLANDAMDRQANYMVWEDGAGDVESR